MRNFFCANVIILKIVRNTRITFQELDKSSVRIGALQIAIPKLIYNSSIRAFRFLRHEVSSWSFIWLLKKPWIKFNQADNIRSKLLTSNNWLCMIAFCGRTTWQESREEPWARRASFIHETSWQLYSRTCHGEKITFRRTDSNSSRALQRNWIYALAVSIFHRRSQNAWEFNSTHVGFTILVFYTSSSIYVTHIVNHNVHFSNYTFYRTGSARNVTH